MKQTKESLRYPFDEYWFEQGKAQALKQVMEIIDRYIKNEKKICLKVRQEWKKEDKPHYPRIYSNRYFAFMELQQFWEELKQKLEKL